MQSLESAFCSKVRRVSWRFPWVEELDNLGYRMRRDGKEKIGMDKSLNQSLKCWRDKDICHAKSVPFLESAKWW